MAAGAAGGIGSGSTEDDPESGAALEAGLLRPEPPNSTTKDEHRIGHKDVIRGLCSTTLFLSLAMLTGSGPSCLFPNDDRTGTRVKPYVGISVNGLLTVTFNLMALLWDDFVSPAR